GSRFSASRSPFHCWQANSHSGTSTTSLVRRSRHVSVRWGLGLGGGPLLSALALSFGTFPGSLHAFLFSPSLLPSGYTRDRTIGGVTAAWADRPRRTQPTRRLRASLLPAAGATPRVPDSGRCNPPAPSQHVRALSGLTDPALASLALGGFIIGWRHRLQA